MDFARNKRLQWYLLKALEDFKKERGSVDRKVDMEEFSDSGWFLDDGGGSGAFDFMKDLDDEQGCEGMEELEEED